MRILTRYLLRETGITFGFVFLAIVVTFLFGALARSLQLLQGLPLILVGEFLVHTIGYMSPFLFPTSLLVAVLVAYGRFSSDNEMVAVQAAGLRPIGILLPAFYLAIPFTIACFLAMDWLQPNFHRLQRHIQRSATNLLIQRFQSKRREASFGDYLMSWESSEWSEDRTKDAAATFHNVLMIQVDRDRQPIHKLTAKRVTLTLGDEKLHLDLTGTSVLLDRRGGRARGGGGEPRVTGELLAFEGDFQLTYDYDALFGTSHKPLGVGDRRLWDLVALRSLDPPPYPLARIDTEIHQRLALACASLVFVLIGAPLGLLLRRGSRLTAFFVAVCVIAFYYALFHFSETLGSRGDIPPTSVWIPDSILFIAGLVGMWKLEHVR